MRFQDCGIRGSIAESFELSLMIVEKKEGEEVVFQLFDGVVVVGANGVVLEGAVKNLDLPVGPRAAEFGPPMLDPVAGAGGVEGMSFVLGPETRRKQLIGELHAIVGEEAMDFMMKLRHEII